MKLTILLFKLSITRSWISLKKNSCTDIYDIRSSSTIQLHPCVTYRRPAVVSIFTVYLVISRWQVHCYLCYYKQPCQINQRFMVCLEKYDSFESHLVRHAFYNSCQHIIGNGRYLLIRNSWGSVYLINWNFVITTKYKLLWRQDWASIICTKWWDKDRDTQKHRPRDRNRQRYRDRGRETQRNRDK